MAVWSYTDYLVLNSSSPTFSNFSTFLFTFDFVSSRDSTGQRGHIKRIFLLWTCNITLYYFGNFDIDYEWHCYWIGIGYYLLFLPVRSYVALHTVFNKCCVKWLIYCIHYIKRKSFKDTFKDASLQYNFSHICAQQFSSNSTLKALVCSLKAQYACCFDADSVLTETRRDRGTNSVWQQPFSLAGIRHGSLYWGEDECCDKVSRTEGEWDCMGLIV